MNFRPLLIIAYMALIILFNSANLLDWPYQGPHIPQFLLARNQSQTLNNRFPAGLWHLNHAVLRSSINKLPAVHILRELGNSLRLACGQHVEWVIWGDKEPLMLFPVLDMKISQGLTPQLEDKLITVAKIIADYQSHLTKEGWTLVIVPIPTKLGIHRELCKWPVYESDLINLHPIEFDRSDEVYNFLRTQFNDKKIPNVDLQTLYRQTLAKNPRVLLYPPNDTHWSGAGIQLAAQATANVIAEVSPIKSRTPMHPHVIKTKHIGDLVKAHDPWKGMTTWLKPVWEFEDTLLKGEKISSLPINNTPEGLVAAVGTSFTGHYSYVKEPVSFAWQLSYHLENVQVQSHPHSGMGAFHCFELFWKNRNKIKNEFSTQYGPDAPKILVWEIPIRGILAVLDHPSLP